MKWMTVKLFIDKDVRMKDVSAITYALRKNGLLKIVYMINPAEGYSSALMAHACGRVIMLPPLEGLKMLTDEECKEQGITVFEINADGSEYTPQSIQPRLRDLFKNEPKYLTPINYSADTKYSVILGYYDAVFQVLYELRNEVSMKKYSLPFDELSKNQQKEIRFDYPATIILKNLED